MNLLRNANAIKSRRPILTSHHNPLLPSIYSSGSTRPFSTEETTQLTPQSPEPGLVYGKLFGITKRTSKSDILPLLEGSNVSEDDVKVGYNRNYSSSNLVIQFPSQQAYEAANRSLNRNARFYRLERSDRIQWDNVIPYDGKSILLQGIPRAALVDDIERFLSGCAYDQSNIQMFLRRVSPDSEPVRMVIVHFPTRQQAMHAFLQKNREFCLNEQISVRVLQ